MPLESLSDNTINIHDLTLEQEKVPVSKSEMIYRALKESPFYDESNHTWVTEISENQDVVEKQRHSFALLGGVLCETIFNKQLGYKMYNNLKESPLYDRENKQWHWSVLEEGIVSNTYSSFSQLLGVLCEAQFDKNNARKIYTDLKESRLYHKPSAVWFQDINEDNDRVDEIINSSYQQLGVLCEAQFDKTLARHLYLHLKQSPLYDENREWWRSNTRDYTVSRDLGYNSASQLLGVQCEALFDTEKARRLYNKLQHGPFYDSQHKQWIDAVDKREVAAPNWRYSYEQLLGVLCENQLEIKNIKSDAPPVPEQRSY